MPQNGKDKDSKKADELSKLFSGITKKGSTEREITSKYPTRVTSTPSATDFEQEWKKKIEDSKEGDASLVNVAEKKGKRAKSLDEVYSQLRRGDDDRKAKNTISSERLGKIGESIKGELPKIEERELLGGEISGIYKIHNLGSIPPLNLLSKVLYGASKNSLENDLQEAKISLYAEEYVNFSVAFGAVLGLLFFVFLFLILGFSILIALIALLAITFIAALVLVNLPSLQIKSGSRDIDRQLPFALRHMSALLGAGIGIFDSIVSVSKADYGPLSTELDKVAWDVKSGENLAEALEDSANRIKSKAFTRVTIHIRRALQMGGDVASIISEIADDMTFEVRMKVSDFVEKLNAFAIVYIIGGIVGPVVIAVFTVVGSAGPLKSGQFGGGGVSIDNTMLIFFILVLFPMAMAIITYTIKVMEPKV